MKYMEAIMYGIIIAFLCVILSEVIRVGYRVDRVYDQLDEISRDLSGYMMTGRVGEVVK